MISCVHIHTLTTYPDERGYFREVARDSDLPETPRQLSHSFMHAGTIKAWHVHSFQWDYWYLVTGRLKVVLYDMREDSPTYGTILEFFLGDEPVLLCIPPDVAHGCKALSDCHLLYLTSNEYDGTDEGRLAHDDPGIDYDWLKGLDIK